MTIIKNKAEALLKPIKVLPPQLANQIAAGEVVERPASVVKELVENSLDADANQIQIDIEQGGQKRIVIRDNGKGISKDQLSLALSRHATSKISDIDDLEHITSMGFRGEALASISSVSRLTLTSKPKDQSEAWQAQAEGLQMRVDIQPAAHPDGTSIEVSDLFFNTPARRKFLRTGKTEFQHIEQIVKRIALARPDVQFVLTHNHKVCCRYQAVKDLAKRVEQVCGKNMLKDCTSVNYEYDGVKLSGWCSKLGAGAATRDAQYTFVNGRMMKDKLLSHALRQVYEDTLAPQSFATYVLYLQVSPEQLDVNVHPAKHEVRFHQARQVHDIVYKAVNDAVGADLRQHEQTPNHDYIQPLTPAKTAPTDYNSSPQRASQTYQGYQANRPSGSEIKANHDFYQSIHEGATNMPSQNTSNTSMQSEESAQGKAPSAKYLYSAPYLVFACENACIQTLHIKHLLKLVIEQKVQSSTIAQPLLMPVSVETHYAVDKPLLEQLSASHFIFSSVSRAKQVKIILKQVPSELRHLPWANIVPQVNFESLASSNDDTAVLTNLFEQVAKGWAAAHTLTATQIEAIMNGFAQDTLEVLRQTNTAKLDLSAHRNEQTYVR